MLPDTETALRRVGVRSTIRRFGWIACLPLPLILSACAGSSSHRFGSAGSSARSVECAPYAREVTGIQLYGDAASWWDSAAGRYGRSTQPSAGAVLVFRRSNRLPAGHVSVVSSLASQREVMVTQANWVHGRIARSEPVVDVSPGNDWSAVRVWWEPAGQLGTTVYPTFGFIEPASASRTDVVAANDPQPWSPPTGVAR